MLVYNQVCFHKRFVKRGEDAPIPTGILVLGHGSKREAANQLVVSLVERLRTDLGTELVEPAFLQLTTPDVGTGLARLIQRGCHEIFVLSLFLVSGNHHTYDSGAALRRILERYPEVSFTMSEPLLLNPSFYSVVVDRLGSLVSDGHSPPEAATNIEQKSFEIVDGLLAGVDLPQGEKQVVRRVVHATADPAFALSLTFHHQAVSAAVTALRQGKEILVDVNMVAVGIDQRRVHRLGSKVVCAVSYPGVAVRAKQSGLTRTQVAMREMLKASPQGIVVVGNAPTALTEVVEAIASGQAAPPVVIGVPVGFVGASEAKEKLAGCDVPFITNRGPRGGSAVAVAIVNALLRLAEAEHSTDRTRSIKSFQGGAM